MFSVRSVAVASLAVATVINGYLLLQRLNFIEGEQAINTHLPNVYRVVVDGSVQYATSMPPLAESLKRDFSEVIAATRLRKGDKVLIETDSKRLLTDSYYYVDQDFFRIFGYELGTGLPDARSVVLSAGVASKLYGDRPMPETILLEHREFQIRGVLEKDAHSHLEFDFILPMSAFQPPSFASLDNWGWLTFYTYVKLSDESALGTIEEALPEFTRRNGGDRLADAIQLHLQPAHSIYRDQRFSEDGQTIRPLVFDQVKREFTLLLWSLLLLFSGIFFLFKSKRGLWLTTIGSIILSIWSAIDYRQVETTYRKSQARLGFDPDVHVLEMDHRVLKDKFVELKKDLMERREVALIGGANHVMEGIYGTYRIYSADQTPGSDEGKRFNFYPIHEHFFEAAGIRFLRGADPSSVVFDNDTLRKLVVNQQAANLLRDGREVMGERFYIAGQGGIWGEVIGVVEDFHFDSFEIPIGPLVCFYRDNAFNFVLIKARDEDRIKQAIDAAWTRVYQDIPPVCRRISDRRDYLLFEQKVISERSFRMVLFLSTFFLFLFFVSYLNRNQS